MYLKYFVISVVIVYLHYRVEPCVAERVSYIVTERPVVIYFNKDFCRNVSVSSRRYSRRDPIYYINIYVESLVTVDNDAMMSFYFYEFRDNRYYRTFVEIHFRICDFVESSTLFGKSLKRAVAGYKCPFQPGQYHFLNLSIPLKSIPKSFPFKQGRLYLNMTINKGGATVRMGEAYIDLEVKVASGNKVVNID